MAALSRESISFVFQRTQPPHTDTSKARQPAHGRKYSARETPSSRRYYSREEKKTIVILLFTRQRWTVNTKYDAILQYFYSFFRWLGDGSACNFHLNNSNCDFKLSTTTDIYKRKRMYRACIITTLFIETKRCHFHGVWFLFYFLPASVDFRSKQRAPKIVWHFSRRHYNSSMRGFGSLENVIHWYGRERSFSKPNSL